MFETVYISIKIKIHVELNYGISARGFSFRS